MIRLATVNDLDAVYELYKRYHDLFGFIMRITFEEDVAKGKLLVAEVDGSIKGFCRFNVRQDRTTVIYDICIAGECRGQGLARQIVDKLGKPIELKCPAEFESNEFYKKLGFRHIRTDYTKKTHKPLNVYRLEDKKQKKLF